MIGHRVMPVFKEYLKGKVIMENNEDKFVVDAEKKLITLEKVGIVGAHYIYLVG